MGSNSILVQVHCELPRTGVEDVLEATEVLPGHEASEVHHGVRALFSGQASEEVAIAGVGVYPLVEPSIETKRMMPSMSF